jgi:hypothetical protein
VAGSCDHDCDERSSSVRGEKFLDELNDFVVSEKLLCSVT